jgi:hypothetical protein
MEEVGREQPHMFQPLALASRQSCAALGEVAAVGLLTELTERHAVLPVFVTVMAGSKPCV